MSNKKKKMLARRKFSNSLRKRLLLEYANFLGVFFSSENDKAIFRAVYLWGVDWPIIRSSGLVRYFFIFSGGRSNSGEKLFSTSAFLSRYFSMLTENLTSESLFKCEILRRYSIL